ncbi:hypothetical protein DM794_05475 [Paenarthrobacter ureafaciens]|nr:hypothetical protein [Paenarthrobacter ureafaciens]
MFECSEIVCTPARMWSVDETSRRNHAPEVLDFARVHYLPGRAAYLLGNWLFTLDDHIRRDPSQTTK